MDFTVWSLINQRLKLIDISERGKYWPSCSARDLPSMKYFTFPSDTCVMSVCQPAMLPLLVLKMLSFFQLGSGLKVLHEVVNKVGPTLPQPPFGKYSKSSSL